MIKAIEFNRKKDRFLYREEYFVGEDVCRNRHNRGTT